MKPPYGVIETPDHTITFLPSPDGDYAIVHGAEVSGLPPGWRIGDDGRTILDSDGIAHTIAWHFASREK